MKFYMNEKIKYNIIETMFSKKFKFQKEVWILIGMSTGIKQLSANFLPLSKKWYAQTCP